MTALALLGLVLIAAAEFSGAFGKRDSMLTPKQLLSRSYPGWSVRPIAVPANGQKLIYGLSPSPSDPILLKVTLQRRDGAWAIAGQRAIPAGEMTPPELANVNRKDPVEVVKSDPRYAHGNYFRLVPLSGDRVMVRVHSRNAYPDWVRVYLTPKDGGWIVSEDNLSMWKSPLQ